MRYCAVLFLSIVIYSCQNNQKPPIVKTLSVPVVDTSETIEALTEVDTVTAMTEAVQRVEEAPQEIQKVKAKVKPKEGFERFASFHKKLDKPKQHFKFNPNHDTIFVGKEGTELTIAAHALETLDGSPVDGPVDLSINEYYGTADMLMANLTTTSHGRLLETGGMLHIEAFSDGERCRLKEGEMITLSMPTKVRKDDMELFVGVETKNGIDWELEREYENDTSDFVVEIGWSYESEPEFPGGVGKLIEYFQKNLEYPEDAKEAGMEGKVYVEFKVNVSGYIKDVRVLGGRSSFFDQPSIAAIYGMPRWKPAMRRGQPVEYKMSMPISYSLDGGSNGRRYRITAPVIGMDVSAVSASAYLLRGSKLGWINCDRFYREKGPKTSYFVAADWETPTDVKMVFKDFKSILPGRRQDGNFVFSNIPIGAEVTLVGIKKDGEQLLLSMKDVQITERGISEMQYEPVSIEVLKEKFKELEV